MLLGSFDILDSCQRQSTFLWQVSGPRFLHDDKFLQQGLVNYFKFLLLKPKAKRTIIVPTYQIDLFWHTHMLSSISLYNADCTRICNGMTLNHDDSLNDRSEGGILDRSFRATVELWKEMYNGEDYSVPGGMYRGEPPVEFYNSAWSAESCVESSSITAVVVEGDVRFAPSSHYFSHLVGKVGASSTALPTTTTEDVNHSNNVDDRSPSESIFSALEIATAHEAESMEKKQTSEKHVEWNVQFIPARPKSRKPGHNANPTRPDYVFGYGSTFA